MNRLLSLAAVFAACLVFAVHAQPATSLIVPFPAGGSLDGLARIVAQKMAQQTGESFVVENRAGANGSIASRFVAQSRPDGSTLLFGVDIVTTVNPFLYPSDAGFSPDRDLKILRGVAVQDSVLVVHPAFAARTVKQFVEYARQHELTYGSGSMGSAAHLAMEYLGAQAGGLKLAHIPYKGAPPALLDLLAGRLQASFVVLPAALAHIRSGKLVALAVASPQRAAQLPDVPTMMEQGYEGFEVQTVAMVMAPQKMPADTAARVERMVAQALADPDTREQIAAAGWVPRPGMTGAEATAWADGARARWGRLIRDKGIRGQ